MSVTELPRLDEPDPAATGPGGPDHPMRKVTQQVAFEPDGWTEERRAKVVELFDSLAPEWHTRASGDRARALRDALARGGAPQDGVCLELGAGIGMATPWLVEHFDAVQVHDLSVEMLTRADAALAPRVLADASVLPHPDGSIATLVCQNMLLFPGEFDRVLRPDGALVWVNTSGDQTPIHLTADEVDRALPGEWDVVASAAGWGTWAVARRAR
ncbi:MAG: class I SAM-dependent methyltransferase [Actinomycetota bacterium]